MNWFNLIKGWYPRFWTKEMVKDAVLAEKITEAQYEEITGEPYTM